jgi:pimeloyl-ACP methyl ester carboxylesterase
MADPTPLKVQGSSGLDLNLLEWSKEGVPLLLLHGFGNEAHIWDDFAPSVAPYYRTLALDHRGHGDSAWDPDGNYDYETLADDVEAVTAALEIDRFVLIGHSLGGRTATFFAGRHPERLAGLVLIDIGPEIDARGSMRIRDETVANMDPAFGSLAEYARLLSLNYPAATAQAIQRMALHSSRQREDGKFVLKQDPKWRGVMQAADGADPKELEAAEEAAIQQQWEALRKLPCPTLVVRGAASDILSPDVADRMVDDELQNAKLAIVAQAGHSVMTDNPEGFREAVTTFVLGD